MVRVHRRPLLTCASSVARRQIAFGTCFTHLRQLPYTYFGSCLTLRPDEGDERGGAAIQGGLGGHQRWPHGQGGRRGLGGEPSDVARLAGSIRSGRPPGLAQSLPPPSAPPRS